MESSFEFSKVYNILTQPLEKAENEKEEQYKARQAARFTGAKAELLEHPEYLSGILEFELEQCKKTDKLKNYLEESSSLTYQLVDHYLNNKSKIKPQPGFLAHSLDGEWQRCVSRGEPADFLRQSHTLTYKLVTHYLDDVAPAFDTNDVCILAENPNKFIANLKDIPIESLDIFKPLLSYYATHQETAWKSFKGMPNDWRLGIVKPALFFLFVSHMTRLLSREFKENAKTFSKNDYVEVVRFLRRMHDSVDKKAGPEQENKVNLRWAQADFIAQHHEKQLETNNVLMLKERAFNLQLKKAKLTAKKLTTTRDKIFPEDKAVTGFSQMFNRAFEAMTKPIKLDLATKLAGQDSSSPETSPHRSRGLSSLRLSKRLSAIIPNNRVKKPTHRRSSSLEYEKGSTVVKNPLFGIVSPRLLGSRSPIDTSPKQEHKITFFDDLTDKLGIVQASQFEKLVNTWIDEYEQIRGLDINDVVLATEQISKLANLLEKMVTHYTELQNDKNTNLDDAILSSFKRTCTRIASRINTCMISHKAAMNNEKFVSASQSAQGVLVNASESGLIAQLRLHVSVKN